MVKIVQKEEPILHQPAKEVPTELFGNAKLKKIINEMSSALAKEDDGVALAAPQIGKSLRIFVVSGKIFTSRETPAFAESSGEVRKIKPDLVFINPTITSLSKTKEEMEEGCLSVRWYYGLVKRSTKVTVSAYDKIGRAHV